MVLKKLNELPKRKGWKSREYREVLLRALLYCISKKNKCRSNFKTCGPLVARNGTIGVPEHHHHGGSLPAVSWCTPASSEERHQCAISHEAVRLGWISNWDLFKVRKALQKTGYWHSTFPLAVWCCGHLSVKKLLSHHLFSHILFS